MAVSCLRDIDPANVLPPLTAHHVMRVGNLPMVPHHPPGDVRLAKAVAEIEDGHHAILLANHGPVAAGNTLKDAVHALEELEETANIFLALRGMETRPLTESQVDKIKRRYASRGRP